MAEFHQPTKNLLTHLSGFQPDDELGSGGQGAPSLSKEQLSQSTSLRDSCMSSAVSLALVIVECTILSNFMSSCLSLSPVFTACFLSKEEIQNNKTNHIKFGWHFPDDGW